MEMMSLCASLIRLIRLIAPFAIALFLLDIPLAILSGDYLGAVSDFFHVFGFLAVLSALQGDGYEFNPNTGYCLFSAAIYFQILEQMPVR